MQDKNVEYEFVNDDDQEQEETLPLTIKFPEKTIVEENIPKVLKKQKKKKPIKSPRGTTPWFFSAIVIAILLLYIHAIYNVVDFHYESKYNYYKNQIVYPLRIDCGYNTTSKIASKSRHLDTILKQLELHLLQNPEYIVLCSHHLQLPVEFEATCVVYNNRRSEFIHMLNPFIIGNSRQQKQFLESSVSCHNDTMARRYEQVIVEWRSPHTGYDLYSVFDKKESVALQLALDELKGNKHCQK